LDGGDLENFVLKALATVEEVVNDLGLLDRDGVEVDILQTGNLAVLNKATQLGNGNPSGFFLVVTVTTATTTITATIATATKTSTLY
jgi:hypothetical protein